ncbi:hypothetical protein V8E36_003736 [Tilletia maclaganii]
MRLASSRTLLCAILLHTVVAASNPAAPVSRSGSAKSILPQLPQQEEQKRDGDPLVMRGAGELGGRRPRSSIIHQKKTRASRDGAAGVADPGQALIAALRKGGLNAYADLLAGNTDFILADGTQKVVLALTDAAVARLPRWIRNDTNVLQATLLQHTLVGSFPDLATNLSSSQSSRIHTIAYSMLAQGKYANLPGNNGQAVAMSSSYWSPGRRGHEVDGQYRGFVNEALNDNEFRGDRITVGPITVVPLEHHITVPGPLRFTLDQIIGKELKQGSVLFNPASASRVVSSRSHEDEYYTDADAEYDEADDGSDEREDRSDGPPTIPEGYSSALAARLNSLAQTPGLTMFIPSPQAVNAFISSAAGRALLQGTDPANSGGHDPVGGLLALTGQHTVEARTLYSPLMRDLCDDSDAPPVTTASGTLLSFTCAGGGRGGKYPTAVRLHASNDTKLQHPLASANIVQSDILYTNGVAHLLDGLLLSLDSDKEGAAKARSAALRKASASIVGPLSGINCGDGGAQAGNPGGPAGVIRPPVGQSNGTSSTHTHVPKRGGAARSLGNGAGAGLVQALARMWAGGGGGGGASGLLSEGAASVMTTAMLGAAMAAVAVVVL